MEISTDINRDDYSAFVKYVHSKAVRMPSNKIVAFLFHFANVVVWLFVIFLFTLFLGMFDIRIDISTAAGSLVVYYIVSFYFQCRIRNKAYLDDDGIILGQRLYVIDDDGILEKKDYYESRTNWPAIKAVEETKYHIFVMMDKSSGYIMPKRSFAGPSQVEQLSLLIKHKMELSK